MDISSVSTADLRKELDRRNCEAQLAEQRKREVYAATMLDSRTSSPAFTLLALTPCHGSPSCGDSRRVTDPRNTEDPGSCCVRCFLLDALEVENWDQNVAVRVRLARLPSVATISADAR